MIWKKILWINIIVHILAHYSDIPFDHFALWPNTEFERPYQYITHMFLHASFTHILFNMLAFLSFAPMVEKHFGSRNFLIFYLLSGLGAAFLHIYVTGSEIPMVGASGAIFGVLIVSAILEPDLKVLLFFIIPLKAKWIVPLVLIGELYFGIMTPGDHIAHFAHLGGALTGGLYFLINKKYEKGR